PTEPVRHCEERSDEAIQVAVGAALDCFASLAMTMDDAPVRSSAQQCSYFQWRRLPSLSCAIVWASRFARVSSRFASVTHSTDSRLPDGGKASQVAFAAGSAAIAARRSCGTVKGGLLLLWSGFTPSSTSDIALRVSESNVSR